MSAESFKGKYFRTAYGDIKASKGWFGKVCLLGLISFIPIFGQMTMYGYAYEWAHKAAWGVDEPMPRKIYGRPDSKMLRWGWFALVIAVVFMLIPSIISSIGGALGSAGMATGFYTATGRYMLVSPGNALLSGLGWLIDIVSLVLSIFACVFIWVATIRMTMYDRLGTGFQFGKIWAMVKQDFSGLMRIFGMLLIFECVGGIIMFLVVMGVLVAVLGAAVAPLMMMLDGGMYSDASVGMYVVSVILMMLPVFIAIAYVALVFEAFVQLLVARAVGYWARQFDVASWGTKDDPLPEMNPNANAQPQPPVAPQPEAPAASQEPAQAAAPASAEVEVAEVVIENAEDDVVAAEVEVIEEAGPVEGNSSTGSKDE